MAFPLNQEEARLTGDPANIVVLRVAPTRPRPAHSQGMGWVSRTSRAQHPRLPRSGAVTEPEVAVAAHEAVPSPDEGELSTVHHRRRTAADYPVSKEPLSRGRGGQIPVPVEVGGRTLQGCRHEGPDVGRRSGRQPEEDVVEAQRRAPGVRREPSAEVRPHRVVGGAAGSIRSASGSRARFPNEKWAKYSIGPSPGRRAVTSAPGESVGVVDMYRNVRSSWRCLREVGRSSGRRSSIRRGSMRPLTQHRRRL